MDTRLRFRDAIVPVPVRSPDGRELVLFQDREQLASVQVAVSPPFAEWLRYLLDGTRDRGEVLADWQQFTDHPSERLSEILGQLDRALLLEGEAVEVARARALVAYRSQGARPAICAGTSYPLYPAELAREVSSWREASGTDSLEGPVRAVLAPHIDPRGGGACHGAAAAALAACEADVFVILGTAHVPLSRPFALTMLDYETPAGPISTDRALAARLVDRGGGRLLEAERAHALEHSVEFQATWLRVLHSARPELRIVPVLVGSDGIPLLEGRSPGSEPAVADFVGVLRELGAEYGNRLALVASVDLAHVGPAYGDATRTTPERLAKVLAEDRRLLEFATAVDAEGWHAFLRAEHNQRNVCGSAATYVLLAALADRGLEGRLLRHDAWEIDPETGSHVSFAAVAYLRDRQGISE